MNALLLSVLDSSHWYGNKAVIKTFGTSRKEVFNVFNATLPGLSD